MNVTFTGIDEFTDIEQAIELSKIVEIAFLFSSLPNSTRYPLFAFIKENIGKMQKSAVHICGQKARLDLIDGNLDEIIRPAQRIQLNGKIWREELELICSDWPDKTIITQWRENNHELTGLELDNHAILVDGSGGRGISPGKWERPKTNKQVGFAGGLGPDNIKAEMKKLKEFKPDWLDMENKIRKDDKFNLDLCWKVVNTIS